MAGKVTADGRRWAKELERRRRIAAHEAEKLSKALEKKAEKEAKKALPKTLRCRSKEACNKREDVKAQKTDLFVSALKWCAANGKGAKACIAESGIPLSPLVSFQALHRRLMGTVENGKENFDKRILTELEEADLVQYLRESNLQRDGKNTNEIGVKVCEILLVRHAQNLRGGRKNVKFSPAAHNIIKGSHPSASFFQDFFARHHTVLKNKVTQHMEHKRAAAGNETTVQEHFEGMWGLRAELIDAGIMDWEGRIADPRRVLNRDETPQFCNYASNKGNAKGKTAAGTGDLALSNEQENRECNTVDMTWGLDGFQYGCHMLIARKAGFTEALAVDPFELFDEKIYEDFYHSTYGLVTTNDFGVQTGESCLQAYIMLDRELTARKIPRPVVMLSDNHASRKAEIVLAYCKGDCKRHHSEAEDLTEKCECRIRQHFEPTTVSNLYQNTVCQHFDSDVKNRPGASSGFLQALDQFNKKFHMAYTKERKRYQEIRRLDNQSETINTSDFFTIVSQIWPHWSTPSDRRTAFRKVGILQNRLDSSLVDRSKFTAVMPEPPCASVAMSTVIASPAGVAKDTAEYFAAKLGYAQAVISKLSDREVGPAESGILVAVARQPARETSRHRITDGHGSVTMANLYHKRVAQRIEREVAEDSKRHKAEERASKKAAADTAAAAKFALWRACQPACTCGATTCPVKSLVLCPHCDELKSRTCGVAKCKAAALAEAEAAAAALAPEEEELSYSAIIQQQQQ